MPRQRSKKASDGRKSESKPATAFVADSEENDSESEHFGMSDIDEEEAELTRLLLGGGVELQTSGGVGLGDEENSENAIGEEEDEADAGIEDLADEDVRNPGLI